MPRSSSFLYHRSLVLLFVLICSIAWGQPGADALKWTPDGNSFYKAQGGGIVRVDLPEGKETVVLSKEQLTPSGLAPLEVENFSFSADGKKLMIFTNTKKVWRYNTRGDYWVLDLGTKQLRQLGKDRAAASLMFAKFSPDGSKAAYVSEHNIYVEDLAGGGPGKCLTSTEGTRKLINGTFDWVYEEELDCRDGFRWSPDGQHIAYWQIDANKIRDYLMLNTTDSLYPFVVPVEYPTVGQDPSPYKIGVIDLSSGSTKWMDVPGDPRQTYLPRMEWASNSGELILQQLNRKQNDSKILLTNIGTGNTTQIYEEQDSAFIECKGAWQDGVIAGWDWLNGGKEFLWVTEKDGWRHIYRVSRDGKKETLVTRGNYDIITVSLIDEKNNYVYFIASPDNATQKYLYRTRLDGKGKLEKVGSSGEMGTHEYDISPNAQFALHSFSNANTEERQEWLNLATGKALAKAVETEGRRMLPFKINVEFFKVRTADGVDMDGWMVKPKNFDPAKKYPVVFYVYGEPAAQTVEDSYGTGFDFLYAGDMAADGYIYISLDNRGTPAPKGREWRKSIYRHIGRLNIRDQAMAAREILKWPFVDSSRTAVWGWSGGAASTLNLMFQYPDIYKTGIAVAAITDQVTYDNIYEERYMGLVTENPQDYVAASPLTYAKNLKGNLLYIHGTGDDNVHYKNAELLLNALIKYNKVFQFMAYPNRSHGVFEGEGTRRHLATLYTDFLRRNCPGGGR